MMGLRRTVSAGELQHKATPAPAPLAPQMQSAALARATSCSGQLDHFVATALRPREKPSQAPGMACASPSRPALRTPGWLVYPWALQALSRTLATCSPEDLQAWHSLRAIHAWAQAGQAALPSISASGLVANTAHAEALATAQRCIAGIFEELACPMHQGLMEEPYGLVCGHIFEAAWLWRAAENQPEGVACPSCRAKSPLVLPPDSLTQVLHTLRAFCRLTGDAIAPASAPPAPSRPAPSADEDSFRFDLPPIARAQATSGAAALISQWGGPALDASGPHTRLQVAAQRGNLPWVQMLIARGSDLNCYHLTSEDAASVPPALYQAVLGGHLEVVRALIVAGAEVHMPCERWSLLHEAAGREGADLGMVVLLLAAGCDPRTQALGQDAADLAREVGNDQVVALLDNAASMWGARNF